MYPFAFEGSCMIPVVVTCGLAALCTVHVYGKHTVPNSKCSNAIASYIVNGFALPLLQVPALWYLRFFVFPHMRSIVYEFSGHLFSPLRTHMIRLAKICSHLRLRLFSLCGMPTLSRAWPQPQTSGSSIPAIATMQCEAP